MKSRLLKFAGYGRGFGQRNYFPQRACRGLRVIYQPLFSTDLNDWSEDAVLVSSTPNGDGTVTDLYRSREPANQRGYVKVGLELR
jgi:hypothetical protein